jgi:hypothetical protein
LLLSGLSRHHDRRDRIGVARIQLPASQQQQHGKKEGNDDKK